MRYLLLLIPSLMLTILYAQTIHNGQITIGQVDSIHSKILNETRQIWISVPGNGSDSIYAPTRYPVVYLLDGETHFTSFVGMMQYESGFGNTVCPPMIVVGISNTDRARDFTPTHIKPDTPANTSGGGEQFLRFIQTELIPYMDAHYPTAPFKMLIGHSLGGLLAVQSLLHHPTLFNSYIVIDPSLWWDDQLLLKQATTALAKQRYDGISAFFGVANTLYPMSKDTLHIRTDTAEENIHIRSILQMADKLQTANNGLNFNYNYYKNDGHMAVPFPAEYDALHYLFDFYHPSPELMNRLDDTTEKYDAVAELDSYYQELSKRMKYSMLPDERFVNSLGYQYMYWQPKKAYALLLLNIKNYPQSLNVFDSMGDYYTAQKNKTKAIEYYRMALQRKEYANTRKKLNDLLAEK